MEEKKNTKENKSDKCFSKFYEKTQNSFKNKS